MTDYKSAHLAWISQETKKGFIPKEYVDWKYNIPYLEMMRFTYSQPACTQEIAEMFYNADMKYVFEKQKISRDIIKKTQMLQPTDGNMWFVTINFKHDVWTIPKCVSAINKIIAMEWILKAKCNFELFRTNGEHPHCHILLQSLKGKNDILDRIFRPKYIKDLVINKNSIDVKPYNGENHDNYINLIKIEEKMESVGKDIIWRQQNNIPDFQKNWN